MIAAVAIEVAPTLAAASGRGVANVQAYARIMPVAPNGKFSKSGITATFQVTVVLGFHFAPRLATASAYGIKIGLFVQKTSVLRASHTEYYENAVNFVKILVKYATILYNNVSTLPIILGGNYNGF